MRRRRSVTASHALLAAGALGLSLLTPLGGLQAQAASVITVTTTAVGVNESDGKCSLVEAIYAANFDASMAIKATPSDVFISTECAAGSGADTIVLPAGAVFTTSSIVDDLHNPMGPTATPIVFTPIVIEGNGARIERSGPTLMRAFAVGSASIDINPGGTSAIVSGTGDLTVRNLHVKGFVAQGGEGGIGGDACERERQYGGRQVGHGESPHGRVAKPHRHGGQCDHRVDPARRNFDCAGDSHRGERRGAE